MNAWGNEWINRCEMRISSRTVFYCILTCRISYTSVLANRTLQRSWAVGRLSQTSLMNAFRNAAEVNTITQHWTRHSHKIFKLAPKYGPFPVIMDFNRAFLFVKLYYELALHLRTTSIHSMIYRPLGCRYLLMKRFFMPQFFVRWLLSTGSLGHKMEHYNHRAKHVMCSLILITFFS
jgi:hypothetical protein